MSKWRSPWRRLIPPRNYYTFELYRDAHRAHADEYLLRTETKGGVFFLLRPKDFQPDAGVRFATRWSSPRNVLPSGTARRRCWRVSRKAPLG
jgi:hypothetical protein